MYKTTRTEAEIDAVLNWAAEAEEKGRSQFPGMSYEQGAKAALDWVLGIIPYPPNAE